MKAMTVTLTAEQLAWYNRGVVLLFAVMRGRAAHGAAEQAVFEAWRLDGQVVELKTRERGGDMAEPMTREKVEWLGSMHPARPGSTHYAGCAENHIRCALQLMIDTDAALRATIQQKDERINELESQIIRFGGEIARWDKHCSEIKEERDRWFNAATERAQQLTAAKARIAELEGEA